jgi:predicted PurR-regulated permease PerM
MTSGAHEPAAAPASAAAGQLDRPAAHRPVVFPEVGAAVGLQGGSPAPIPRTALLIVLSVCILLLGGMFVQVILPFLLPLFLAAALSIVCEPIFCRMMRYTGDRRPWAAALTTGLVICVVVLPVLVLTVLATAQLMQLNEQFLASDGWKQAQLWDRYAKPAVQQLQGWIPGLDEKDLRDRITVGWREGVSTLGTRTLSMVSSTVNAVLGALVSFGMLLVALYYFLSDGPSLIRAAEHLLPIPAAYQQQLRSEFSKVTRAVVLATFLAAFAQGLATAVALQVLGFGYFVAVLLLGSVAALIPLVGTWIVWGPCVIWLWLNGHSMAAVMLLLWGSLVVGMLDNVVRTYVLNSDAQLHPLLAFVSVLGALQVLGLWGIFIGPIIASCLSALLKIFNRELQGLGTPGTAGSIASS